MARNLIEKFVVLSPDKRASIEIADSGLYQRLEHSYKGFSGHELIAIHEFDEDWDMWEMHPHGDELVVLLSGQLTMILNLPAGKESVTLSESGEYAIVPKGVWHTAATQTKSRVLFVTPGEGTENKTEPE